MTINTRAFSLTEKQGVIVITPAGDSLSFRDIDLQREGNEIKQFLEQTSSKRVIVDLERSHYFGSLMIGLINSFGQTIKKNGGEMYLCNASPEMLTILKVMKLDTLWPHFPTLAHALKVAKSSMQSG